jgi:hypothetical protein
VLTAAYSKLPYFVHSSPSSTASAPLSQTQSIPLVRTRTLTGRNDGIDGNDGDDGDEEMVVNNKEKVYRRLRLKLLQIKRSGFGLSEDDLYSAPEEGSEAGAGSDIESSSSSSPAERRAPSLTTASAASLAGVSNVSVRGSPIPLGGEKKGKKDGKTDYERFDKSSPSSFTTQLDVLDQDDRHTDENIEDKFRSVVFRLPSPNSPDERRRSRSLSGQASSAGVWQASSSKLVNQLQPKQRRRSTLLSDDEESIDWPAASAQLSAPVGLFSRPSNDCELLNAVISEASEEPEDLVADKGSSPRHGVRVAEVEKKRYFLPEPYDSFDVFAGEGDVSQTPPRAITPVGFDFDPPASSPVSKSLAAFLEEAEEQTRLVRDAETHSPSASPNPPSSLFGDIEADLADLEELKETARCDALSAIASASSLIDALDSKSYGAIASSIQRRSKLAEDESEDDVPFFSFPPSTGRVKMSSMTTPPRLTALESDESSYEDVANSEDDESLSVDSDFEADENDPDFDEVDLDTDVSVAHYVDSGAESGEVDEHDGMGAEDERWEDGVSEMLVEVEMEETPLEEEAGEEQKVEKEEKVEQKKEVPTEKVAVERAFFLLPLLLFLHAP